MTGGRWESLSEEEIYHRAHQQPIEEPVLVPGYRHAAVLVPFLQINAAWHLLFTRRTETVQSHKGQVSFPGGAIEPQDSSPEAAAVRESEEEIGLCSQDVKILGRLPYFLTVSNYLIVPVLACIPWPYQFTLSAHEVSRVFTIPLHWLADPPHWSERPRMLPSGKKENVIIYEPYDGEVLWGISARITHELLDVLQLRG